MICIIGSCENEVISSNEVNIGIGIQSFSTLPICEQCMCSDVPEIKKEVEEAINNQRDNLPF